METSGTSQRTPPDPQNQPRDPLKGTPEPHKLRPLYLEPLRHRTDHAHSSLELYLLLTELSLTQRPRPINPAHKPHPFRPHLSLLAPPFPHQAPPT